MQRYSKNTIYTIQNKIKTQKTSILHHLCTFLNVTTKKTKNMQTNHHKFDHRIKNSPPRRKLTDDTLISIVFIIIATLLIVLCAKLLMPTQPPTEIQTTTNNNTETYSEYTTTIKANQQVEIHTQIDGFLEKIHFFPGSYVNKNDILFTIDSKAYNARVQKAKAQLNRSKALALKAEHDLARIKLLHRQKAASRLELDNAIASHESAKAEVIISEADLSQALTALNHTIIRAPISGFISESTATIGTLINPTNKLPLATITNIDTIQINLNVTELDYLRSIEPGTISTREISITLADSSTLSTIGTTIFSTPQLNSNPGSFLIHIQIPNPNHTLLPGQSVKIKLPFKAHLNP